MASAAILPVLCFIFNHSFGLAQNSSDATEKVQALIDDFVQMCPGVHLCKSNTSVIGPEIQPRTTTNECCKPCRCDKDCRDSYECCPDIVKDFLPLYMRGKIDTSVVNCISPQYTRRFDTPNFKNGYMFISRCPPNFADYNLRYKCERGYDKFDFKTEMLMNFMPVSDINTGKTFKNKHCFDCSKDTGQVIAPWDPVVECSTGPLKLVPTPQKLALLLHDTACSLHFEFPIERFTRMPVQLTPCTNLVDECNYTKSVPNYDRVLDQYCRAYKSEYKEFKNVHCSLCNNVSPFAKDSSCSSAVQFAISRGVIDAPGLINAAMRRTTKSSARCKGDLKSDAQSGSCLNRQCPSNMLNDGRVCKPLFRSLKNTKMHLNLRFLTIGTIVYQDSSIQNLSKAIPHIVNTFLQANADILNIERVAFDIDIKLNTTFYGFRHMLSNVTSFIDNIKNASVEYIDANIVIDLIEGTMATVIDSISQLYHTDFQLGDKFQLECTGNSNWLLRDEFRFILNILLPLDPIVAGELHATYVWGDLTGTVLVLLRQSGQDRENFNIMRITPVVQCLQVILEAGNFIRARNETNGRVELTVADRNVSLTDVVFLDTYDKLFMCENDYDSLFTPIDDVQVRGPSKEATIIPVTRQTDDNVRNSVIASATHTEVPIIPLLLLSTLFSICLNS